ncbi:DUF4124 domain-containing protein [Wenzhouxiangella sp. AB-CW3]|uniref:DUF4124 domain-containing protein n=1 Tax=Wenzhouxiangella sp. AB-CW3 TaxID=2771012 RepID=UPI00168BFF63|nr:DUF4124 domain-containing protein [Wenzhouxiangella sp. AB-CW3]QOC22695.1 DUF4124 domain-containing protein [Wenzhouxiangella sp. AB-CW3]
MSTISRLLLTLALMSVLGSALAQTVYRWVDEEGEVHYGHSVPPEHARRGYEILGRDGIVRERVEPAPTTEELAERRAERRRARDLAREQRSQEARDRRLLATHSDEESILSAKEVELVTINSQRASIRVAVDQIEHRFERLMARAAEHSDAGRSVPPHLEEEINQARDDLRRLRGDLDWVDEREAEIRERYRNDLERFRELTGRDAGS